MLGSMRAGVPSRPGGRLDRAIRLVSVLALLLAVSAALIPAGPASAATTRHVAPTGVDEDNDCTEDPCRTIQHAVDVAALGDTIDVAAGTYDEAVTIPAGKDQLTLVGADAAASIVEGGFLVQANGVTIEGFTVDAGSTFLGERAGIYLAGSTHGHTVTDNVFVGPGEDVAARAILIGPSVETVTLAGNEASGWATGVYMNPGTHDVRVSGNHLHGNVVGISGDGIQDVEVVGNDIADNSLEGFAAGDVGTYVRAHLNRIVGNGTGVQNYGGEPIAAENNWWGCNEGPGQDGCDSVTGEVGVDPWLTLTVTTDTAELDIDEEATLTASLTINNDGADTAASGTVPDGITVTFAVSPSGSGTLNPQSATIASGKATTTFTANAAGTATISAAVDGETAQTSVTVADMAPEPTPEPTHVELDASTTTPTAGQEVTLRATVTDADGEPFPGVDVIFTVEGVHPATETVTTDADGEATFSYTGQYEGTDTVTATVDVNDNGEADDDLSASVTLTWTVESAPPPPPEEFAPAQPAAPQAGCTFFTETQHNLCAGFRSYWENFGGLATFGFPVTEEFVEDGVTVQYFERARFEWHPGAWPERYDVLLGLLGREVTAERGDEPPFQRAEPGAADSCTYYEATGHNLCFGFRSYWERFGGLAIYGYPISEEFVEENPDTGERYTVQYFERARFEWHPGEFPPRFDVLLGRLGAWVLHVRHGVPYP